MKKQRQIFRPRSSTLALEPRVMFDGAAAIAVDEHPFIPQLEKQADVVETRPTPAVESTAANPAPATIPTTLLVVDGRVADYQSLLSDLPGNVMVRVINPGESGLAAINSAISGHTDLQSIQIISHGSSGSLSLGTDTINSNTLSSQGSQIQSWAPHLSGDADILLYGCDIGAGTAGTTLLTQLASLTGADIAASTDATGASAKGGDWVLEQQTGQIESRLVVSDSALSRYEGLFAEPAIGGATAGQTVNDNATSTAFSAVTITDSDAGDTQSLTVTLDSAAKGTLSILSGGTYDAGAGVYTFSGTTADAQAAIQALVFAPTANRVAPGSTETTTFTISVNDGTSTVTDSTTTVISTSINDTPAAVADTIAPSEDTNTVPTGNILANDTDFDTNDPKTVTSIRLGAVIGAGSTGSLGSALIGTYGSLTLATDGNYTYTLDNASLAIQSLGVGQTLNESFNYTMRDTAGSTSSAVITVTIHGTNDAPVATAAHLSVTTPVPENATDDENPGVLVSALLKTATDSSLVSDIDTPDTTPGIAAYGSSTTNGMTGSWQYQLYGSATWTTFTPTPTAATLIPYNALIRFVAAVNASDSQESGSATLQYYAWDSSSGSAGGTVDTTSGRGGSSSISTNGIDVTFNISARNDVPTLIPVSLILNEDGTATITATQLPLTDPDNSTDQLTYRVETLPSHGLLLKNNIPVLIGTLFTQADVVAGRIQYQHSASELSANQADSITFSVRDGAGGVINSVTLPITIQDLNAQIAITGTTQTVPEYIAGAAAFSVLDLGMNDADGNPGLMTITITTLPDPAVGKLQYWNGSAYVDVIAGTTVTKTELLENPLHFISTGVEPTTSPTATFNVTATDGHLTLVPTTDAKTITLTIAPQNDPPTPVTHLLPVSTTTPNPVITTAYLTATDPDSSVDKRVYTISSLPVYGEIHLNGIVIGVGSTFTQADLDNNHLSFQHNGGIFATNTADSFNFRANDSDGGVSNGTLAIDIGAGTYTESGGAGGTLTGVTPEGLFISVSSSILKGSDSYTLTDLPDHGAIYLNGVALTLAAGNNTFTQENIDAGNVVYVHDGTEPNTYAYADTIVISRTGGSVSESSTVTFAITPVNDAPTITQTTGSINSNTSGGTLMEHNTGGGDAASFALANVSNAVKLTTANLQSNDSESTASLLFYILDQSPGTSGSIAQWNGSAWIALDQGARFSAADVESGKIAYFHNSTSETRNVTISVHLIDGGVVETGDVVIGGGTVVERGYVTVNDGTSTIQINKGQVAQSPSRTITFNVSNVNDPPVAADSIFTVEEGTPSVSGGVDDNPGRIQVLNATILTVSDPDNALNTVIYSIKTLPTHGRIEVDTDNNGSFEKILVAGDLVGSGYAFTKTQLDAGRLRYVQDGSEFLLDSFTWGVNDNETGATPFSLSDDATVTINILPVNDPPVVFNNVAITVNEGSSSNTIDSSKLGSPDDPNTDTDNSDQQTQFRITTGVQYGTLYLNRGGVITTLGPGAAFTLDDIQQGYLKYTHNGSEPHLNAISFQDGFDFTISDASGMNEPSAHFVINLTPINDPPAFTPSFFGATTYIEDSSPVAIGATVVFSDPDLSNSIPPALPNLNGGILEIAFASPVDTDDVLSIINTGTAAGQIGVSGNDITYAGTSIGSIDGTKNGTSGQPLLITFNSNVISDAPLQALIRAIAFSSSDHANPVSGIRNLTITYDADGSATADADQVISGTATVTVSQINDRPLLTTHTGGGNLSLQTISEDAASSNTFLVSALLNAVADATHTQIDDVDTGAVKGIAVTGLSNAGTGRWQFSADGTTWTDIGTVSNNSALLLNPTYSIRFLPDAKNGGTATVTYKAWDQTSGSVGSKADTTSNNTQTSAFSTATDTAEITVTVENDAPVLAEDTVLSITHIEDDIAPSGVAGTLVSTLVGGASDVDTGALKGIAITSNTSTNGIWHYSINGGTDWILLGLPTDSAALLLAADINTRLYFQPGANYNGTQSDSLTIRAWDTTSGTNGATADTSGTNSGGITAFSSATDVVALTVTPVNDLPTISPDKTIITAVTENSPLVISSDAETKILVFDVEANRNEGTGANQGLVSVTVAVPNGLSHGKITLGSTSNIIITAGADNSNTVTFKGTLANVNTALDNLSFTPGDDTNLSENVTVTVNDLGNSGTGTTTALEAAQTITISAITPTNDAPTAGGPATVTATEDVQFSFIGASTLSIADADARSGNVEVALSILFGTLNLTTTDVSVINGASGTSAVTIQGTVTAVNTALATLKYTGTANSNSNNQVAADRTLHMVVSDLGNSIGGTTTTPAAIFTKDVIIAITPFNDAPLLTIAPASATQTPAQDAQTVITGITVADTKDSDDTGYAATTTPSLVITALHGKFTAFTAGNVTGVLSNGDRTITLTSTSTGITSLTDIDTAITNSNLKYTGDLNFSGTDTLSLTLHDNGQGGTGYLTSAGTITLTISGTNEAPSIVDLNATTTFTENSPAFVLDDNATLTDPELSVYNNWGNAILTLVRTSAAGNEGTAATDDVFSMTGSGDTGVNFSDSNVRIGTVVLGTFTNASGQLQITFANSVITTAQVNQVLQAIKYANVNNNPPTQVTIGYTINDGDTDPDRLTNGQGTGGAQSGNDAVVVTITAINDAPLLGGINALNYTEDGSPVALASALTLSDPELSFHATTNGNWGGASLTIVRNGGANILDVFTASGTLGTLTEGQALLLNGSPIGTVTHNSSGSLTLTFNDGITTANVQAALAQISYSTSPQTLGAGETSPITLNWTLHDGDTDPTDRVNNPQGTGGDQTVSVSQIITLQGVNDAPVLTDTALAITVTEDGAAPVGAVGVLISSLTGGITDSDSTNPRGIAITAIDSTLGIWSYSTDNGATWNAMGVISDTSSLLLRATDRVHFLPTADLNGAVSAGLTLRAWDQSTGVTGNKVSTTTNGDTSAFSTDTDIVALTVSPVNDAPTRLLASVALDSVNEDNVNPSGKTVINLFTLAFSDATDQISGGSSANTLAGVAIVGNGATAAQGIWQYSTDGTAWNSIATTVSTTDATLLAPETFIRFVPAANFHGSPGVLTTRLIDSSSGAVVVATAVNIGTTGGITQYSNVSNSVILTTSIASVNDAPGIAGVDASPTFIEGIDSSGNPNVIGTPVVLDATVTISDIEIISQAIDTFGGTTLTVARDNGSGSFSANVQDIFGLSSAGTVAHSGSVISVSGTAMADITSNSNGQLLITFRNNATTDQVNAVVSAITYALDSDTPPANITLRYRFNDDNQAAAQGSGGSLTNDTTIIVAITSQNDPPIAVDDTHSITENSASVAGDVIAGMGLPNSTSDSDPESDALTVTAIRTGTEAAGSGSAGTVGNALAGAYGSLILGSNGTYSYLLDNSNPAVIALQSGTTLTESYTYTISDGHGNSDVAQLTVTINGQNDPPDAVDDGILTTPEDTPLVNIPVLSNDSDPEGDTLTVTLATVPPSQGTVSINPNGTLNFIPARNFNGTAVISYTISDGHGGTDSATVTIHVSPTQDPPVAVDDSGHSPDGRPVTVPLLANDSDPDGDTVTVTTIAGVPLAPGGSVSIPKGLVTLNADGTITFAPNAGVQGQVRFPYEITDGNDNTATAYVTITVVPEPTVNAPDTIAPLPPAPPLFGDQGDEPDPYFLGDISHGVIRQPIPFAPVVYVQHAVQLAQHERMTSDSVPFSMPDTVRLGDIESQSIGAGLGFTPVLFVQQAVRASQAQGELMNNLVNGRLTRLSLSSDRLIPTPDLSQPNPLEITPPTSRTDFGRITDIGKDQQSVVLVEAQLKSEIPVNHPTMNADRESLRPAPSFSEQLRAAGGRMPNINRQALRLHSTL